MSFMTAKRLCAGVLVAIATAAILFWVGVALRSYLYDLAGRSLPEPPLHTFAPEVVHTPGRLSHSEHLDSARQDWSASPGRRRLPLHAVVSLRNADSLDVLAGDYVLFVRDAFARDQLRALAQQYGVRVLDQYGSTLRVRVADRRRLAALLAALPGAVEVEANIRMRIPLLDETGDALPAPATPYRGFGDQALAWLGIETPDPAWGRGVRVAVLDTGVMGVPVGERFDLVGQGQYGDHGALVASILHQALPSAELLDFQVMSADGTGDSFTVAKGIREAVDAGANLINLSIGTRGDSRVLAEAVQYALDQDVLIVASAGNEGVERISYPAAYEGVLSVAAVDAEERHLHFSNRGDRIDLAAPGVGVTIERGGDESVSFSGTSAAAPFVTATAGIALSSDQTLQGEALRRIVLENANDTGEPGENTLTGKGIVSPQRIRERDDPGIVDMAVLRPHFDLDADGRIQSVTVAAQNRGTVDQREVEMVVSINDREYRLDFANVGRNRTVAHTFDIPQGDSREDVLDVRLQVLAPGDIRPKNNQIRSLWMPDAP